MQHFKIILTVETMPDVESPERIFKRIERQVMEGMVLDCQTIRMDLDLDTTDPTMPMGPNGNQRVD